jgi:hypothetical protein
MIVCASNACSSTCWTVSSVASSSYSNDQPVSDVSLTTEEFAHLLDASSSTTILPFRMTRASDISWVSPTESRLSSTSVCRPPDEAKRSHRPTCSSPEIIKSSDTSPPRGSRFNLKVPANNTASCEITFIAFLTVSTSIPERMLMATVSNVYYHVLLLPTRKVLEGGTSNQQIFTY